MKKKLKIQDTPFNSMLIDSNLALHEFIVLRVYPEEALTHW